MTFIKNNVCGVILTIMLAFASIFLSSLIPYHLIGSGVFSLLIGMSLNPLVSRYSCVHKGLGFVSKKILRLAVILMGGALSFVQVFEVGKISLVVMIFTLMTAFGFGYIFGRLFKMNWKLSSLISAGTGICGGSAVAAIAPVIDAEDSQIAYAISATFIFDVIMVILFPIMGRFFNMTDLGYGLWAGTAVNDTSSVVAAGYAFSDTAGSISVIVKLTRTLSIVPVVLIFSYINERLASQKEKVKSKVDLKRIFPWFILMFLVMVGLKSTGVITEALGNSLSGASKFLMVMSLGAVGLKTNFRSLSKSGLWPMLHGFIISTLVVVVAFLVQSLLGQV